MKGFVIALTVLAVVVVLALFYGARRPASSVDGAANGVERTLGWLVVSPTLTFDDVASASCADRATGTLVIDGGDTCEIDVPSPAGIVLCADDPTVLRVTTDGNEFPEQQVDETDITCGTHKRIPFYDEETVLALSCSAALGATCTARIP